MSLVFIEGLPKNNLDMFQPRKADTSIPEAQAGWSDLKNYHYLPVLCIFGVVAPISFSVHALTLSSNFHVVFTRMHELIRRFCRLPAGSKSPHRRFDRRSRDRKMASPILQQPCQQPGPRRLPRRNTLLLRVRVRTTICKWKFRGGSVVTNG